MDGADSTARSGTGKGYLGIVARFDRFSPRHGCAVPRGEAFVCLSGTARPSRPESGNGPSSPEEVGNAYDVEERENPAAEVGESAVGWNLLG